MISERMLDVINQGKVTISIDGKPVMALDINGKSLGFDISGLEKTHLKISSLFQAKTTKGRMFLESSQLMRKLVKNGWKFSLYDKGEQLLTASGPSRLGPRLRFNPLKLKRILRVV
jgi:hypothetical protein